MAAAQLERIVQKPLTYQKQSRKMEYNSFFELEFIHKLNHTC